SRLAASRRTSRHRPIFLRDPDSGPCRRSTGARPLSALSRATGNDVCVFVRGTNPAVALRVVVVRDNLQSASDRLAWFQGARRTIEAGLGLLFLCLAAAVACHPPPAVGSFAVVCSRVHVDRGLVARRAGISPGG